MVDAATITACASALPAHSALIRISGPRSAVALAACDLPRPAAWRVRAATWQLTLGPVPCRVLWTPAGRSYTGCDAAEITLPGAPDLVHAALAALHAVGVEPATAGAFTRQALANGRLALDQAEAVLAVAQAGDAAAARSAVARLRGGLAHELEPVRQRLLEWRARVEAGLDFLDEEDVQAYDPAALQVELDELLAVLRRWVRAAGSLGERPEVCLAGPANAGKSALFAALTGHAALVSARPGTTRDWLDATWRVGERDLRLVDTAGWADHAAAADAIDAAAIAAGRDRLARAAVVVWCSAPDAPLSPAHDALRAELPGSQLVVATKSDLGAVDPRAVLACSAEDGAGLAALGALVARELAAVADGDPRQQRLLASAIAALETLTGRLPDDLLIADALATAAAELGDLLGVTTADEVLGAIFSRFCIGK